MSAEMTPVRCKACGGAVAARPGSMPTCLFCGNERLEPYAPPEGVEHPTRYAPFVTTPDDADAAFRKFARRSIWYPSAIRTAKLDLRRLLLPAWAWSGDLETHWTGLVRASTRSGKAPVAGQETARFDQVLVPASPALRQRELSQLGPFDEDTLATWSEDTVDIPHELGELTRSAARAAAEAEMVRRHEAALTREHGLVSAKLATLAHDLAGAPVLVPIYIGVYRHRGQSYRVIVQGQSGALIGSAPTDWGKVALAFVLATIVIAVVVVIFTICLGGTAAVTNLG